MVVFTIRATIVTCSSRSSMFVCKLEDLFHEKMKFRVLVALIGGQLRVGEDDARRFRWLTGGKVSYLSTCRFWVLVDFLCVFKLK